MAEKKKKTDALKTVWDALPPSMEAERILKRGKILSETVTELRLRTGGVCSLTVGVGYAARNYAITGYSPTEEVLREILARLTGGSLHSYDEELKRGYFAPLFGGGIRVGVAGRVLTENGSVLRLQHIGALCIRIPQEVCLPPDCGLDAVCGKIVYTPDTENLPEQRTAGLRSTLFFGNPGCGKTTLLRHLIARFSDADGMGLRCAVIDSGEELIGRNGINGFTDVFSGYPRGTGISLAVRAFSPEVIVCDEIGDDADADAILHAQVGGVPLVCSAHADSVLSLLQRPAFEKLHRHRVFDRYVSVTPADGGFSLKPYPAEAFSC